MELLLIHNTRESKVGDKKIGIVFGSAEEEILGLEIAMYYAVIVEVGDSRESGADEVCSIGFVV